MQLEIFNEKRQLKIHSNNMLTMRLLFLGTALAVANVSASAQSLFAFSCQQDSDIPSEKRTSFELVAMDFVHKLLGPNPETVFDMMSEDGKRSGTREQLKTMATETFQRMQLRNLSPVHSYFIKLKGQSPVRIVCGSDFSKPDSWESLEAANVPEQAHVLISAKTVNNLIVVSVWLVPEQGAWKVQSFWMNAASMADLDSMKMRELAQAQQAKGNNFNAVILYTTAAQLANRGPSFQLRITQAIAGDLAKIPVPSEIRGPAPFFWKDGENTFKVLNVGPIAVGGKIHMMLVHEVAPWQSDTQVEGWNKELLKYFKKRFPEYSDSFAGLIARAHERGGHREFGTVENAPTSK
jgi:hypothetical protein